MMSGSADPSGSGMPNRLWRLIPTMTAQTAISVQQQKTITGLGPKRWSARPPAQVRIAAAMAAMMPKTPISTVCQPSTRAA
jgi:hypothetical protein